MTAIEAAFASAGVDGWLHAVDLATGAAVGHAPDEAVVLASVFKVPVVLELFRQAAEGQLDASELVTVPAEGRSPGPFGLSAMRDPVTMSWRDLAWLMMGVSDNAATDVICDRVGIEQVNLTLKRLGLEQTFLVGACRDLFDSIFEDLGVQDASAAAEVDLTDPCVVDGLRVMDPTRTTRSTPREITRLLAKIWHDEAAPAAACAEVRRVLGLQVWPHRLASGFPEDGVRTSGKTGTLPRWRNEVGVVEHPDGGAVAVAVFTRAHVLTDKHRDADAVIGRTARMAVEQLRSGSPHLQAV